MGGYAVAAQPASQRTATVCVNAHVTNKHREK